MPRRKDPFANLPQRIRHARRVVYVLIIVESALVASNGLSLLPGAAGYFALQLSLGLMLPLIGFALHLRDLHRRVQLVHRRSTHCRHCEYDLTGNVSGKCPECGTPVDTDKT